MWKYFSIFIFSHGLYANELNESSTNSNNSPQNAASKNTPFKKALENNVNKNGVVLPNLKAPNVGVDIDGKGHKIKKSAESVVAFVTSIYAGGKIKLLGNNTIIDEGTQYQSGQSINIIAKDYFNKSAVNSGKGDEKKERTQGG